MEINNSNENNFWNTHTLKDYQQLLIYNNVHSRNILSVCFLKDGSIASASWDYYIFIYNKNTFEIVIRIKEKKRICYMNVTKDGILITCLVGTNINLYEIQNKKYKNIQTIRPYSLLGDFISLFDANYSIQKFVELKNGKLVFLVWQYGICFYEKKKNSKKYSYLNKFEILEINQNANELVELEDNEYCVGFSSEKSIKFLNMNLKKITNIINIDNYYSYFKNKMILMNKNDLLISINDKILVIDVQRKIIVKNIYHKIKGSMCFMYKLTDKMILLGGYGNYFEQIEYDGIKKNIKVISNKGKKDDNFVSSYGASCDISSISVFNNNLIVTPYNNKYEGSSIIIYQLKNI